MPNTPVGIGQGVTALFTTAGDLAEGAAEALFSPAGTTVWFADESDFDAVTAVSGSGPAYVYAFIEALAAAGAAAGLEPGACRTAGAGDGDRGSGAGGGGRSDPGRVLRERVTSPDGTTAAGLARAAAGAGAVGAGCGGGGGGAVAGDVEIECRPAAAARLRPGAGFRPVAGLRGR